MSDGPKNNPITGTYQGPLNQGQGEPSFSRTTPLVTIDELKDDYLFGLPLQSAMTGQELKDATIARTITRAVSDAETLLRIPISPTRVEDTLDYKRADDANGVGTHQLTRFPILKFEQLQAAFPGRSANDSGQLVDYPVNWIAPINDAGLIRIVPVSTLPSPQSGDVGVVYPVGYRSSLFNGLESWPNYWRVTYIAGFDFDRIPAIVNDLIATLAAMRICSLIAPTIFPANGISIGFDGMSQSTSTMGPQHLVQRYQELMAERDRLAAQLKAHYGNDMIFTVI